MSDLEEMGEILTRTGGPAFPATYALPSGGTFDGPGMTLRDWFAGQAVAFALEFFDIAGEPGVSAEDVAANAYEIADAMLAARAK